MRFEALRETLLKGGVAPRHVRRYLRELDDHLADLTAQQREAGYDEEDAALRARARLGEDGELAAAMLEKPQFRSWAARAPWAVFGLLPPAAAIAVFFAAIAPLVLVANLNGLTSPHGIIAPPWFRLLAHFVTGTGNLILAPLLAAFLAMIAHRQRLHPIWPLLGIGLVALMDMQFETTFPASRQGGSIGIGAMLWMSHWNSLAHHGLLSLAQLLLTLLPAVWLIRKYRQFA